MQRDQISEEFKWDVETILDEAKINIIKDEINEILNTILTYQGKISRENLEEIIELDTKISRKIELVYIYYSHQLDQDHSNTLIQGKLLQISNFYQEVAAKLSFVTPEITNLDLDNLNLDKKYDKYISDLKKIKKHVLSSECENIMTLASDLTSSSYDIYSTLTNAEMKFTNVMDSEGNENELSEAKYSTYIYSYDRTLRSNTLNNLMDGYKNINLTLASILINHLKSDAFKYKARGFNSTKEMYLSNNHITTSVYDNLVHDVNKSLKFNHDYMQLRKEVMGYDDIHLYDMYVPIVANLETTYTYDDAKSLILEAFKPLGTTYVSDVEQMLNNKTIDVYPNDGKRTGAYSGGSYDSKSYVLLNYTDTLNDVFTLAHEVGHSMHTNFAKSNDYMYANYKIFVAEIASTVNELLLFNHMLKNTNDSDIKKYLLSYNLDQYRTTVFRQTMFAEFEDEIHKLLQNNSELQADVLNELYYSINKKYFGENVVVDEAIKYEWSRIQHFYYHFYVYQYATSFLVASLIVNDIINDNNDMVKRYINFLSLGDSVEPLEAIRTLGIDLEQENVFLDAINNYGELVKNLRSEYGN